MNHPKQHASAVALHPSATVSPSAHSPSATLAAAQSLRAHWLEYLMEGALLGCFMISACVFGVLLEHPASPLRQALDSAFLRRTWMGLAMGLTAVAIIYSPWGKQSGAHINPAVTLSFLRLGKIRPWDTLFYIAAQFIGAALSVYFAAVLLGNTIADPSVRYVVTIPGPDGPWLALLVEIFMAATLMFFVLRFAGRLALQNYTGLVAGLLVAVFITAFAPFSGMSINPARSFGSAYAANTYQDFWIYLSGPPLGMLAASEFYLWRSGRGHVSCAKLHHSNLKRCIFCGANGGFSL